jgi:hypothetical protein
MKMMRNMLVLGVAAAMLGGCSTLNSLTGQTDNTVLPGKREEAIPGRAQFPDTQDSSVTASTGAPVEQGPDETPPPAAEGTAPATQSACAPDDPACAPASGDDAFSDPQ